MIIWTFWAKRGQLWSLIIVKVVHLWSLSWYCATIVYKRLSMIAPIFKWYNCDHYLYRLGRIRKCPTIFELLKECKHTSSRSELGHIRKVAILISVAPTSRWSESSNVSLVVLDKLLFSHINLLEKWIKQCKLGRIRQVAI